MFNVATGRGHSIKEIYDLVRRHLGLAPDPAVKIVPVGSDDVRAVVPDPTRRNGALGWRPKVDFRTTIQRMLDWYDAHGVNDIHSHLVHRRRSSAAGVSCRAMISRAPTSWWSGEPDSSDRTSCISFCHKDRARSTSSTTCCRPKWKTCRSRRSIHFTLGSIAEDRVLENLPRDLDYVFHLACYHGNQSSIADPIADHDNNTITTLKLFDRLKAFGSLKKVVYAAAGCAVAEKTFGEATATQEDAPLSLYHDSPYSISKIVGELYSNYYFRRHGLPVVRTRFQNVYGPREILGAGRWRGTVHTVWRNVTPSFIWKALHGEALPLENGGIASRDFVYVEDLAEGLQKAALRGTPGEVYNLASGVETRIRDLADMINELAGNDRPGRP